MMRCLLIVLLVSSTPGVGRGEEDLLKSLRALGKEGAGSPAARAAWERLVARGAAALPALLDALDTPDTVAANWLRTAFDRIVEVEVKKGGGGIDVESLLKYVQDPRRQGRARRLALEVAERLRPGVGEKLLAGRVDDPEFGYDAINLALKQADSLKDKNAAAAATRAAFTATRDLQQAKTVAARLKALGVEVSVADHLGFLRDWTCVGPFDAKGMKGFATAYPPESGPVDLAAAYDGKKGKVRWRRHRVVEPPPTAGGPHVALVNLREPLGDAEDAVAYAYTAFEATAGEVEFRGAGDDNLTVWVNGRRAFGFEEYRNGVRFDRHRFKVRLRAGVNTVLVKIGQAPRDASNTEPNWEFLLRVVGDDGKGRIFPTALPPITNQE